MNTWAKARGPLIVAGREMFVHDLIKGSQEL